MASPARVRRAKRSQVQLRADDPRRSPRRGPRGGEARGSTSPGSKPRSRQAPHTSSTGRKTGRHQHLSCHRAARPPAPLGTSKGIAVQADSDIAPLSARRDLQVGPPAQRHTEPARIGQHQGAGGHPRRAPAARRRSPGPCGRATSSRNVGRVELSRTPSPGRAARGRARRSWPTVAQEANDRESAGAAQALGSPGSSGAAGARPRRGAACREAEPAFHTVTPPPRGDLVDLLEGGLAPKGLAPRSRKETMPPPSGPLDVGRSSAARVNSRMRRSRRGARRSPSAPCSRFLRTPCSRPFVEGHVRRRRRVEPDRTSSSLEARTAACTACRSSAQALRLHAVKAETKL